MKQKFGKIDATDLQILQILQKKARIPNVEVARKVGMAPSAVLERIKKLESQGVIQGYEVRLNSDMFECSMIAFVHIRVNYPDRITEIGQKLSMLEQIQEVHYLSGQDCLMIKLRILDNAALNNFLQTNIAQMGNIKALTTYIALSTYKESAKIKLPSTYNKE